MMLFMLLATDVEGTAQARAEARPAHLARLEELDKAGRLLTAGPNPMPDNPDIMS
ncbi:YciI family protein, partial [Kingella kingae]